MQGLHTNQPMPLSTSNSSAFGLVSSTPKLLAQELEASQMELERYEESDVSLTIRNSRDCSAPKRRLQSQRKQSVATARTGRTSRVTPVKTELVRVPTTGGAPIELIFNNMKMKSRSLRLTGFLDRHQINEKYRAKLIDWMIDVLKVYHQKEQTLFRAILTLDQYFSKSQSVISPEEVHLIGCTVMLIASKQEEIRPLTLESIVNSISRGKFTRDQVLGMEQRILFAIGFQLNIPTIFEIIKNSSFLFAFGDNRMEKFFTNSSLFISKMCLMSYGVVNQFAHAELAAYAMILSAKLLENLSSEFSAPSFIRKISESFELSEASTMEGLKAIHNFTIDFQTTMPYVQNLQRYYSLGNSN
jgi:hypothetical protein